MKSHSPMSRAVRVRPKLRPSKRRCMYWRTLKSDADAKFDAEIVLDAASIPPMVTWGTSAGTGAAGQQASVPDPAAIADQAMSAPASERALALYGSETGTPRSRM